MRPMQAEETKQTLSLQSKPPIQLCLESFKPCFVARLTLDKVDPLNLGGLGM
jgi:hypothetical protein